MRDWRRSPRRRSSIEGECHGQGPAAKQSREEEAEAGQEEGDPGGFADGVARSAREVRPKRRPEKGLVTNSATSRFSARSSSLRPPLNERERRATPHPAPAQPEVGRVDRHHLDCGSGWRRHEDGSRYATVRRKGQALDELFIRHHPVIAAASKRSTPFTRKGRWNDTVLVVVRIVIAACERSVRLHAVRHMGLDWLDRSTGDLG
jgi:hypothetical protein